MSIDIIAQVLRQSKTIAVVGLSSKPARDSYQVAAYLQRHGYRIIPVNPRETEVLGEQAYASLRDVPVSVDIVDVFRESNAVPDIVTDTIAIGAKVLWLQLGIQHPLAEAHAQAAGITVISDVCIKIAHAEQSA
ncbi:MAG: CoA-binding protein [Chloroflexia bacterium]|nr:CoA-binding protein [Chloroflexia bacterium]